MIATVINVILVLLGSALGLLFKNHISRRFTDILTMALGLCVAPFVVPDLAKLALAMLASRRLARHLKGK